MKYYIIEDNARTTVCPTLDSAKLYSQIGRQYKQPAVTSIICGEEELVPYPGERRHHWEAASAPESDKPAEHKPAEHKPAEHKPAEHNPAHRMPYYLLKDGSIFATVSSRKAAIDAIRANQQHETHYMLRSSFSYIHGEPAECVDTPA